LHDPAASGYNRPELAHEEALTMGIDGSIRVAWLKAMYLYTIVGAGGTGLAMLLLPGPFQSLLGFPAQDPAVFKLYGAVLLASGLLAIPALRFPRKFIPLLLLQLVYKPVWLAAVAIPTFAKGEFPLYIVVFSFVFLTYIIGDLIAIPFAALFSKN
jgi:uncharacterized membrane protein